MKRIALIGTALTLALGIGACGSSDDGNIDEARLAEYRAALPSEGQLNASAPKPSVNAKVGDPAIFPTGSEDLVTGINGAVSGIVTTMRTIVNLPPSIYNSDTKEMFWGPYPNENGVGTVAAYVREGAEDADFKYEYALLRGLDNDIANMKPVIIGGATPDPSNKEYGAGVTLWDFDADSSFNDPGMTDKGRFVAVYAKGMDAKGEAAFVVAVFRGFVPKDQPQNAPADLDYFYGRYNDGTTTFDFLDYQGDINVDKDPALAAAEKVGVHMAFLNEGTGRAEVSASGGDLMANESVSAVECWSQALAESYLSFTKTTDGAAAPAVEDGLVSDCGVFEKSLSELGVPSLADVDPALMAALADVAKNGIPQK